MAAHQQHQGASNIQGKQRHHDDSYYDPHDQCVPFPLPDVANEAPGVIAQMLELLPAQRKAARVKKMNAQFNEWKKQKQMQRRHRIGTNLRRDLV